MSRVLIAFSKLLPKKGTFCHKLLSSFSSSIVKEKSLKSLDSLQDKNFKDKPSAKNLPIFAWNKYKKSMSKA